MMENDAEACPSLSL